MGDDTQQDNRVLRAAADEMRSKQRFATAGSIVAAMAVYLTWRLPQTFSHGVALGIDVVALIAIIVSFVPFLRSSCPKCKDRYHSFWSIFRRASDPAPCKSCGFHINKHISRYG